MAESDGVAGDSAASAARCAAVLGADWGYCYCLHLCSAEAVG